MQRFLGLLPFAIRAQQHDPRVRRRDIDQVADPLHIRLARKHPQVPNEHRTDRTIRDRRIARLGYHDGIGTAHRHAHQLAIDQLDRLCGHIARIDVRVDQLRVLHAVVKDKWDFGLAVDVALIDTRGCGFLELDRMPLPTELRFDRGIDRRKPESREDHQYRARPETI